MDAPLRAIGGQVACALVDGASTVVSAQAGNPQKLLLLRPRGAAAVAVVTTYGGGLLAGDRIELDVAVHPGAQLLLSTQSSTKIYRSDHGGIASQQLHGAVGDDALLAVLPDPVCPFTGARFVQRQHIDLSPRGSLILLDWVSAGRTARGERWACSHYESRTRIERLGVPLLIDQLRLAPGGSSIAERLGDHGCIGTLILLGPACAPSITALRTAIEERPLDQRPLISASPLADGLVCRCAAADPESLVHWLRPALAPLLTLLDHDPWQGKH